MEENNELNDHLDNMKHFGFTSIDAEEELTKLLKEAILAEMTPDQLKQINEVDEKNFNVVKQFLLQDETLSQEQKDKISNAKYEQKFNDNSKSA